MSRALCLATVWLILALSSSHLAESSTRWPQFLGPGGLAIQESASPPTELSLAASVRWKLKLPMGHSSPCIWDDALFLTAFQPEAKQLETICIDRTSGDIRWRMACPDVQEIEKVHEISSPAAPTPATDGETVVVYFGSYGLLAYDFHGNLLWKTPLPPAKVMFGFGSGSSPVLVDDKVVMWVALENDSYLGAFRLADGREVWRAPRGQFSRTWATPIQWRENGQRRIGLLSSQRFSAFSADDGREVWWVGDVATNAGSSPVALAGQVLITSAGMQGDAENIIIPDEFDTFLAKVDENGDGKIAFHEIPDDMLFTYRHTTGGAGDMKLTDALGFAGVKADAVLDRTQWKTMREQMIQFRDGPMSRPSAALMRTGGTDDVTQSHRVWEEPRGVGEVPSPLVYRQFVYLIKNGGILTVRSLQTGESVYSKRIRGATGGYFASPVAADGRVYFANDAGVVTVIEAGPTYRILSQCDTEEPIYATPAIVDDTLYVRTTGHLYAFGSP